MLELLAASISPWPPALSPLLRQGVTPLMASALFDHADSVGLLLARGASTSAVDAASRRTALHFAALGDAAHAASALLAASADRSLADRYAACCTRSVPLVVPAGEGGA